MRPSLIALARPVDADQRVAVAALGAAAASARAGRRAALSQIKRPPSASRPGDERVEFRLKTVGESIRRVAEDEVEAPPGAPQVAERVGADDLRAVRQAELVARCARASADVGVDQRRPAGPARERLDRRARRCREEVEDAAPRRRRRGSRRAPRGRGPRSARTAAGAAAALPAGVPSARRRRLASLYAASRLGALVAEALAGPRRAAAPARARRASRAGRAARAPRARASSSSGDVLGKLRDAEARQAVLAGAEDLALAAQREVDLGELEAVALGLRSPPDAGGRSSEPASAKRMQCDSCSPRPTRPRSWWSCESP